MQFASDDDETEIVSPGTDDKTVGEKLTTTHLTELRGIRYSLSSIEPIELSCAVQINDELDLDLTQLEWSLRDGKRKRYTALWSSHGSLKRPRKGLDTVNDDRHRERFAVVDYVTRVNGTSLHKGQQATTGHCSSSSLVRVSHMIIDPSLLSELVRTMTNGTVTFVCSAKNGRGQLIVTQKVSLDTANNGNGKQTQPRESDVNRRRQMLFSRRLDRLRAMSPAAMAALIKQTKPLARIKLMKSHSSEPNNQSLAIPMRQMARNEIKNAIMRSDYDQADIRQVLLLAADSNSTNIDKQG